MSERRNILFIQTDAQHHQWLGFQGAPGLRTPHLDRLARERAVVFDHAYACSGVCAPSRTSLLTGRYTIGHGVVNNQVHRRGATEPTVGHMLRDAGYTTGYFGKTHFGGDDTDMPGEGWDESFITSQHDDYLRAQGIDPATKREIDRLPARYWRFGASPIPNEHYLENVFTDQAARFIDRHANEPFACFVNLLAPHGPFTPPRPYAEMYKPEDMVLAERFPDELAGKPPQTRRWIEQNQKYLNDDELRNWLTTVYGLVTMVDDCVGRLIDALEQQGVLDDTLVVFTSDHGDFATRHGILGKSWCMSDDLLRIPLLIAMPGVAPRRTDALVQTVDLTATMLDWAGINVPTRMHGRSLLSLMRGETDHHRDCAFAYDQAEYSQDRLYLSMVRTSQWKYVDSTGFEGELYDMQNDPLERHNLVADPEHRAVCNKLRHELLQWHLNQSGGFYDVEQATYWEDETCFYDESVFTGERIARRAEDRSTVGA